MSKDFETDELEIRGRMDIEDIVKYQINRCNISSSDPDIKIFNSNVMVLLDLLPAHKREQILEEKKAISKKIVVVAPTNAGLTMSREFCREHGYPYEEEQEFTDFHLLYRIVLDAFADSGLTWKIEQELIELGKVKHKPKPTPFFRGVNNENT